jgi:hypothetical protein
MTNWGKQYESATKRIMKKGKTAADTAIFNAETEKRLIEEAKAKKALELQQQKTNKVELTVDQNAIQNLIVSTMTQMFQQYGEKEIHLKTRFQEAQNEAIRLTNERAAMEQSSINQMQAFMNQMNTMESRIVERLTGDKIRLAEMELELINRKIELAKLQAGVSDAPVEFELLPFSSISNPLEGKLMESISEHNRAVETILDAVTITEDKPERLKKRVGRPKGSKNKKGKVEEVVETTVIIPAGTGKTGVTEDMDATAANPFDVTSLIPAQYIRQSGYINWKALEADGMFLAVVASVVGAAVEAKIDVTNGHVFRHSDNLAGAVYQRFMDNHKGMRGSWKAFLMEIGVIVG